MRKSDSGLIVSTQFVCFVSSAIVLVLVGLCIFLMSLGVSKEMITVRSATYIGIILQCLCVYAGMNYVCRKSENRLAAAMYYILPILIVQLCVMFLIFDGIGTGFLLNLTSIIIAGVLGIFTQKGNCKRKNSRKRTRSYR